MNRTYNPVDEVLKITRNLPNIVMYIIKCPQCDSEIAIDTEGMRTFDIDCDCGAIITSRNYRGEIETVSA